MKAANKILNFTHWRQWAGASIIEFKQLTPNCINENKGQCRECIIYKECKEHNFTLGRQRDGGGECMLLLYCRREQENEWIFNPLDLINKQDIIPVYEEEWGRGHMASPSPANVAISLH